MPDELPLKNVGRYETTSNSFSEETHFFEIDGWIKVGSRLNHIESRMRFFRNKDYRETCTQAELMR